MEHWVYENFVHDYASVHLAECVFCNAGRGVHGTTSERNSRWLGPFDDQRAAFARAEETERSEVRGCSVCVGAGAGGRVRKAAKAKHPPPPKDIEKALFGEFHTLALEVQPDAQCYWGFGAENRMAPAAWNLNALQQFKFGDLRVELEDRTIIVQIQRGLIHFAKFWPVIDELTKPLAFIHLYGVSTENDYISHRLLWEFLRERMSGPRFVAWLFTYDKRGRSAPLQASERFRQCLTLPWGTVANL